MVTHVALHYINSYDCGKTQFYPPIINLCVANDKYRITTNIFSILKNEKGIFYMTDSLFQKLSKYLKNAEYIIENGEIKNLKSIIRNFRV